jgi:phospholipase/carboxylesterase
MLTAVGTYGSFPGPTLLLLHGWGSDERDLAGLAPFLPEGLPWASVRAPLRHPYAGYAWYPLESEDSWDDEPAIRSATDALWGWIDATLGDDARIIPIGFSQGGLMASQLLRTRPERIVATVILSGYLRSGPERADAALATARPRVFWGRGSADTVIPARAVTVTDAFLASHADPDARVYAGMGHSVSENELQDLRGFLDGALNG